MNINKDSKDDQKFQIDKENRLVRIDINFMNSQIKTTWTPIVQDKSQVVETLIP